MALTDPEKVKIRYYLGYPEVTDGSSLNVGIPVSTQLLFVVEDAMQRVIPGAETAVRELLCTLDNLECQLKNVGPGLQAAKVGNIELRGAKEGETYPDLLEREVIRWAQRLADVLGCPPYAYSARFQKAGAAVSGSIPVRR